MIITARLVAAVTLVARLASEAPPGAVPSKGTDSFFADYELQLSPAQAGASPLLWRLPAWRFQQELLAFYGWREDCDKSATLRPGLPCPAPPLNTALFVLQLPEEMHQQMLKECPGLLLSSMLLTAEARLHSDRESAHALFAQADLLRRRISVPGWSLELGVRWFTTINQTLSPELGMASGCTSSAFDIVVAHCTEDLAWLKKMDGTARIWVYEKCGRSVLPELSCLTVEILPNLAMESLAYATHVLRRYDDIAKFTIFVQGNPHEHASQTLFEDALGSLKAGTYNVPFLHLNARRFLSTTSFCLQDLHKRLFKSDPMPDKFGSYCCSQFVVRRDRIHRQPRDLFDRITKLLLGKLPLSCVQDVKYDDRPRIAVSALFEHMWHVVFGEEAVLPPRSGDARLPLFARVDVAMGELPDLYDPVQEAERNNGR